MKFFTETFFKYAFVLITMSISLNVFASETNGTIDPSFYKAFLCSNESCSAGSLINFKTTNGNPVLIDDFSLTGNAWGENIGWINFNPTYGGVVNTEDGDLSGYAWGENAGWINFNPTNAGVSVNEQGEFEGYAWSENYGWIKFDCNNVNSCIKTDWRPINARSQSSDPTTGYFSPQNYPIVQEIPEQPVVDIPVVPSNQPIEKEEVNNLPKNQNQNNVDDDFFEKKDLNDPVYVEKQPENPPQKDYLKEKELYKKPENFVEKVNSVILKIAKTGEGVLVYLVTVIIKMLDLIKGLF